MERVIYGEKSVVRVVRVVAGREGRGSVGGIEG